MRFIPNMGATYKYNFTADAEYGNPDDPIFPNSHVMNALRAIARSGEPNANDALNPRKIVFPQGVLVKDTSHPRGGFDTNGEFWDPWGSPSDGTDTKGHYIVILDGDYNNYTQVYTLNYSDLTYQSRKRRKCCPSQRSCSESWQRSIVRQTTKWWHGTDWRLQI